MMRRGAVMAGLSAPRIPPVSFGFFYVELVAVCTFATMVYVLEYAPLFSALIFATALFGLFHPARLLEGFIFFMALSHRDFSYTALTIHGANIYITEWVLLILLIAAIPQMPRLARERQPAVAAVMLYIAVGLVMFFLSFRAWPLYYALRDFALVYYSLFAVAAFAHVKGSGGAWRMGMALLLGTLPNLAAEIGNYLYGTFPLTMDLKNYSMRNSFYYAAAVGFALGYINDEEDKWRRPAVVYVVAVSLIMLLYSYSKTPMIVLLFLGGSYLIRRWKVIAWKEAVVLGALFLVPLLLTPAAKTFHFSSLFLPSTYFHDSRTLVHISAVRDFTEYPYGIGFGPSIFGSNAYGMFKDPQEIAGLHNSYLAIIRRMGIAGIAAFALVVGTALFAARRGLRAATPWRDRAAVIGMLGAWGSSAIFAFAHVALEGPFFGSIFWLLLGTVVCAAGCDSVPGELEAESG